VLGSCYTQNPPKSHWPSLLTHQAASSYFAAHYHSISLGFFAFQVFLSPTLATIAYQSQGRACTQLCCGSRGGALHRPGATAGHSEPLFIALHHQIWGLLPLCHHVAPLYNTQRQFFLSGVTKLSSLLASSQLGMLPGRVRDRKAGFPTQAHSALPSPLCLAIVQFKRGHRNSSNALLGQQGPHEATEWVPGNANPIPSPQRILYQPRHTLSSAKEGRTTTPPALVCCLLQHFHAHRAVSDYPVQGKTAQTPPR